MPQRIETSIEASLPSDGSEAVVGALIESLDSDIRARAQERGLLQQHLNDDIIATELNASPPFTAPVPPSQPIRPGPSDKEDLMGADRDTVSFRSYREYDMELTFCTEMLRNW